MTERQRAADELRAARDVIARERAVLSTVLANIQDGVALLDRERRIVFANASYAEMFALPRDCLEGMTRDAFIAHVSPLAEDPEKIADLLIGPFQEREPVVTFVRPRRRVLRRTFTEVALLGNDGFLVTWHDATAERDVLAERERQLDVDPLTGILNRRGAEAALRAADARRLRAGTALSVAMFDVDHFKRVNDEHGHAVGDLLLHRVADALATSARATDSVARWGGEEFLAVLEVPLDGAVAFSERARRSVAAIRLPSVEGITISAGVAEVAPGETPAAAVSRADDRLYVAKRAGRNQVRA